MFAELRINREGASKKARRERTKLGHEKRPDHPAHAALHLRGRGDLVAKLGALTEPALTQYVESAQNALRNNALAPSWRPRVELGLKVAQEALVKAAAAPRADIFVTA